MAQDHSVSFAAAEYDIYGVTIASDFRLALPESRGTGLFTISLREASLETIKEAIRSVPLTTYDDWFSYGLLADGRSYVRWRGVGEFLVAHDGREIACAPAPGAHQESFQVYLLGQAFSFALVKAGCEPLHATVLEHRGDALALVGESGRGKSTLAASFLTQGLRLLTDDLMLLAPGAPPLFAYPGPPRLKLLPDAAEAVLGPRAVNVPMNPETDKHVIPVAASEHCRHPARLRGIYVLEHGENSRDGIRIEPLAGREAFMALVGHTFNRHLAGPERLRRQMAEVTRTLGAVPVKRIVYPAVFARLGDVRDALWADAGL
jgi:hypothetical protein